MLILDQAKHEWDEWRPGVLTRMWSSALPGTTQLCVFEQRCEVDQAAAQTIKFGHHDP